MFTIISPCDNIALKFGGSEMPIYEYRCNDCNRIFSVLNRSFSEIKDPVCSECNSTSTSRIISKVTVITSWNEFMKDLPSWETMTDFDEDNPSSVADMLRRVKGDDVGIQGEEMIARSDADKLRNDIQAD